jgi:fibro-slime domain-containing protein
VHPNDASSLRWAASLLVVLVAHGCGSPSDSAENAGGDASDGGVDKGGGFGNGAGSTSCGNSTIDGEETCDDGNAKAGDGCSDACKLEPGWKCPALGTACVAIACGDKLVAGTEECDDGATKAGDGCSATCALEPGWKCPQSGGGPCSKTTCGDNVKEGTEQCDDGNVRPFDGCSVDCTTEPTCPGGTCTAVCGDGLKFPNEACDDGNVRSGDGCSATCALEPGFDCKVVTVAPPNVLNVPIVFRDFKLPHPDFETFTGDNPTTGMLASTIGADGTPVLSAKHPQIASAASFADWYHDTPQNKVVVSTIPLKKSTGNAYVYNNPNFFPIDGKGFETTPGQTRNFHLTSELHYAFTYAGGEVLTFDGDDDFYVFINGKLAVDLGGTHGKKTGTVTLDAATSAKFSLTKDGTYRIDAFHAERHTNESTFKLTLQGFLKASTSCVAKCGDGVKTRDEACDDGNLASGDGCSATCSLEAAVPR